MFGTSDAKLYSLDAKTGAPNEAFGEKGVVNLNTPEILRGLPGRNGLSSPPIVYRNLVITGGTTQENPPRGPAGDVRAWDLRTGKLVWTFHSVPREGEPHNDTWAGDSWKNRSGVNVWGFITVDAARGIVFMPFGAPSVDQYGGDREGDNLFGTSLVAADANTGKYLWHFQVVRHDIWDADLAGAPALIDVKQGDRTIPAVAVIGKVGLLFMLDRVTGKPLFGVEDRPVPPSEVPLERTAKTQPFPLKPPPLSRMSMTRSRHRHGHAGARSRVPQADRGHAARRAVPAGRPTIVCACSSPAIMAASTGAARRSTRSSGICSSTPTSSVRSPGLQGSRRRRDRARRAAGGRRQPCRSGRAVPGRPGRRALQHPRRTIRSSCPVSSRRGAS